MNLQLKSDKLRVHDYWNAAACGEDLYLLNSEELGFLAQAEARNALEGKRICQLARFNECQGLKVLEIGVGLGADHQQFVEAGADLFGVDLTKRAVDYTKKRFQILGLDYQLKVGDAENLDFSDEAFDVVYSWGVLHHTPDTGKAISEVYRVLKPGGDARIMIYHKWSMVGCMLWTRYALLKLKPWLSLKEVYSRYLESPGTKAYSVAEARELFSRFRAVEISTPLAHSDLLESDVGQRHRGLARKTARKIWPRWFLRRFMPNSGSQMMIRARK